MKSDLVIKAEQEARESCEWLGLTEAQVQAHIDMHIEGELRRDAEKAKELASAKRNSDLTKAIINIAVDPFRRSDEVFPSYSTKQGFYKTTEQMMIANHERKRNRGET